jgi:hypothetical protein
LYPGWYSEASVRAGGFQRRSDRGGAGYGTFGNQSCVEERSEPEQPAKKRTPKQVTQTEEEESPLPIHVPQTYRLPQRLVEDLARAAMERKIKRRKPWSQQEIVAEAIGEWLQPSCKQVSKQAYIRPSTLYATRSKMRKNRIEIASKLTEHRPPGKVRSLLMRVGERGPMMPVWHDVSGRVAPRPSMSTFQEDLLHCQR